MKQVVRIIGGQFRGKKISFPPVTALRPTPSRIRETLFNWLMHDIRGMHCLDAFAGSGALGFEAWSRGASSVTFIEQSHAAFLNLKKHINTFASGALRVIETDTLTYLGGTSQQFNLVFLDPPFDKHDLLEQSIAYLEKREILYPRGLIYLESSHQVTMNPNAWEILKAKKTGLIYYGLYQKRATQ